MMKLCCLAITLARARRGQRLSKTVEQGAQLRKRKRIIHMWKIIEASDLVQKNQPETTRLRILVMQFGNVEAEIEFFASFVKADGWLKGDYIDLGLYLVLKRQQELEKVEISDWTTTDVFFMNHIHTCFADNKRRKEQVGWKIRNSLLNVVNGKVPAYGMDWQNAYKVYAPCMLTKYKHWVAVMIDMVNCEIKVYDSMVSLIPDEMLNEELAPLSITIPNLLNTIDFYEEGVYANDCSRDWWCLWPIERVDVPQQSNQGDCGMFVLKYIELWSANIPLATCTSQNMPFFRLKLAAEILRGDTYMA
ncbi:unnamed protein product [Prunus armeniaca]